MCGIVGYVGKKAAVPLLIGGLTKLEYRGYDSAGIAIFDSCSIKIIKARGRLSELEKKVAGLNSTATMGIGHTRWATHGEPNDVNSHPHLSCSGTIAVVHNGIIENYMALKEFLVSEGFVFQSETDTEVVAQLLEYHYKGDLVQAVLDTVNELEGSYALGVLCKDYPDSFVAARKDSPLIVGKGVGENFIASDIPAILEYTRDVYIMEDKEIALITSEGVSFFDTLGIPRSKEVFHVNWDIAAAEKSGYEHFMMKEMCEEPTIIKNTISPRIVDGLVELGDSGLSADELEKIEKIFIVACGTAYHAGVVGKYLIEKLARIPVEVDVASEFRYRDPILNDKTLTIIISQSGETIDTLFALREAHKRGSKVLSIVNVMGSSIARESDKILYTWAGPEIAVASTKAYNAQLSALYLLAIDLAFKKSVISEQGCRELVIELKRAPSVVEEILSARETIQKFASEHFNAKSIFFIGRGLDYALSMEGSLKLKEISYIHSEAYAGGELKHGTIALIEKGTLVVCSLTQSGLFEKMISNMREVKARGAVVMAVTQASYAEEAAKTADVVITIPDIDSMLAPIAAVTPMQLFAYYMAVLKGCDVDKPRNLAKSVTVE